MKKFDYIVKGKVAKPRHHDPKKCDCRLCKRHETLRKFLKKYNIEKEDKKWLDQMFDEFLNAEADLEYYKCILYGEWPSSVDILTRALEKAKEKCR